MLKLFARERETPLPKQFDGVIEAVRYGADRHLQIARIYERRGPTWTDVQLISRDKLVRRLKAGQRFVTGSRKERLASTFFEKSTVRLAGADGSKIPLSSGATGDGDRLDAPLF